ncbi:hypothetical protein [Massilia sp. Leaf139]|uniref:hypothetical protein n=1 Tax=Massilia sp. Leaf139 TaxID=1736272 RepID=UPI0012E7FF9B|nr:hypothetical protein [Massilia sp. Leaf139]
METDFSVEQHTRAVARWSKSELLQLLQFVRLPTLSEHSIDEPDWVLRAFYLAIITVIFVSPFAYLINSLQEYLEIAETRPARIADSATLITVILLTPLVEEAIFRAGLRNPLYSIILAPLVTLGFLIESAVGLFAFLFFSH